MPQVKAKGSIILEILIIVLIGVLVYTIYDPAMKIRAEEELRKVCRFRMKNIRQAELRYFDEYGKYTGNIDSLITFIKVKNLPDSLFFSTATEKFNPDSLRRCPKLNQPYIIGADSLGKYYWVECPYGHGMIGSKEKPEDVNKVSWE
ncbi:hypothetical protein JGI3_01625 [Candidatus Kryptobacter tengchongensis]|uniref:hypothetical protein n=1 Tax=Kryptobacter tengchongensis TaxID=1643429 RepID=UPI0007083AC7|nr:hypothetical protein [Candidatus Kryptobacter tengchongensis]CUS82172.1 hypothetical protein JGI20_00768 [Candidatus Kryptobacter tengchongensis]CUU08017.1 hypothetical protein JGI3_01625 [Candidatus Kryptobacter tengchongensis]